MSKKPTSQANPKKYVLSGSNIYRTKSGQAIFYDKKDNIGYKIPAAQEGLFQTLLLRHSICIVIGLLIYFSVLPNVLFSAATAFFVLFLLEWKYRSLLKTVARIRHYSPQKRKHTNRIETLDSDSITQLILKCLFFIIIGVLFILNVFISDEIKNIPLGVFCSYVAAAISFFFGFRILRIIRQKKKYPS